MERAIVVREAAARMGLSEQRIRAMAQAGRLAAVKVGRDWLVDASALHQHRAPAGRPLGADRAWALLALLAGERPGWLPPSARARMEGILRRPAQQLEPSLRHSQPRSRIVRWRVLPSDLSKIASQLELVRTGLSADVPELDVIEVKPGLDVYASRRDLEHIERSYRPDVSPSRPNLTLRIPSRDWILERGDDEAPAPVIAADLLSDEDPRVRRAAQRLLSHLIDG